MEKLIKKILREIREENPYNQLKRFIEDKIEFEGYNFKTDDRRKIGQLYDVFLDEYGWSIERHGEKESLIEWLMGLPSCIDLPYYYNEISDLLYAIGFDEVKDMEDDELSDFYYDIVSQIIIDNK